MMRSRRWPLGRTTLTALALVGSAGCGTSHGSAAPGSADAGYDGATSDSGALPGSDATVADGASDAPCTSCFVDAGPGTIASLAITPPSATLIVANGTIVTQTFQAIATYASGATATVTASWTATDAPVGGVDATGLYTPKGLQGGVVTVTAIALGQQATATLTVQIGQVDDQVAGGTPAATQSALRAALGGDGGPDGGTLDPTVQFAYPYDQSVFPRGLNAPELMWNNGAASDVYYVRLSSPTYVLESFASAPSPSRYDFTQSLWEAFTNSTAGAAQLTVARFSKDVATVVTQEDWTIGSGSMSGTIYYWAINKAQVVRIKPGASAPDAFLGGVNVTAADGGTQPAQCPSCHSISADGTTLAMSTGPWVGGESDTWSTLYDLQSGSLSFNAYEVINDPPPEFSLAGLTPDGKVLVEDWAPVRGMGAGQTDSPVDLSNAALTSTMLPVIAGTNLETLIGAGHHAYFPVFSPDNQLFAYVDSMTYDLISLAWDPATKTFSTPTTLATASAIPNSKIAYPTLSPDHRWVLYQRGPDFGSLDPMFTGDLYAVDTQNPGTEIALDTLNGKNYPFAAGAARDADRSYEPTFAPVAAGGYFWVVFHSRRTYGNQLTGPAFTSEGNGTKQLWVAAIDLTPTGADPSHEPFWLPGQDVTTLNMRGYWSLPPCAANGQSCVAGSDCCDGFCDETDDAGAPVCGKPMSQTCSNAGDLCTTTADCCNAQTSAVTCVGGTCAVPAPQ